MRGKNIAKFFAWSVLLVLLTLSKGRAQQDPQFSQYMFNHMFLNPGYAGMEGVTKATLLHRTQYAGYRVSVDNQGYGAPKTQVLTVSSYLQKYNSGAGLHLTHDVLGAQRTIDAQLSYAYQLDVADGKLGLGIRGGIYSQTIDVGALDPVDANDNVLAELESGNNGNIKPDLGFGVWYKTKKYYGGLSFNHLNNADLYEFDLNNANRQDAGLKYHAYLTGGYNIQVNYSLVVTPSVLLQWGFGRLTYNIGGKATFNDKFWGGLQARQSFAETAGGGSTYSVDALSLLLGASFMENNKLRVGYAFDLVTSGVQAKNPTSHEIMVSYVLPIAPASPKPIIRTPRYRHGN